MKHFINATLAIYTITLLTPLTIVVYKYSKFLTENSFREWSLTTTFMFTLPLTTLIIAAYIRLKKSEATK